MMPVTSVFGVSQFPQRLRPDASTWVTNTRLLGSFPQTWNTSAPIPLTSGRWLGRLHANLRPRAVAPTCRRCVKKERERTCFFTNRQLVHSFPNGRVRKDLLVELGPEPPSSSPGRRSSGSWLSTSMNLLVTSNLLSSAPANIRRLCAPGCPRPSARSPKS